MSDLISRQDAIDALDALCDRECEYSKKQRSFMCGACRLGSAFDVIDELPSAQPEHTETHDSCTDCPLYDHDRHNCPRFNKVIPATIEAAKPRWIPVTEGEPEEDQECWFTVNDGGFLYVHHGSFTRRYGERRDKGFITSGGFAWWNTATAWMPIFMPDPYREEEQDD